MAKLIRMGPDSALIRVEPQIDFTRPEGAFHLDGEAAIAVINRLTKKSPDVYDSYDWHDRDHDSFKRFGIHCVAESEGAQPDPDLDRSKVRAILMKGVDIHDDIYDSFDIPLLEPILRARGKKTLFIVGSAVPICPSLTAMSGARLGFETYLVLDACCIMPDTDIAKHIAELENAGVKVINSKDIDLD